MAIILHIQCFKLDVNYISHQIKFLKYNISTVLIVHVSLFNGQKCLFPQLSFNGLHLTLKPRQMLYHLE